MLHSALRGDVWRIPSFRSGAGIRCRRARREGRTMGRDRRCTRRLGDRHTKDWRQIRRSEAVCCILFRMLVHTPFPEYGSSPIRKMARLRDGLLRQSRTHTPTRRLRRFFFRSSDVNPWRLPGKAGTSPSASTLPIRRSGDACSLPCEGREREATHGVEGALHPFPVSLAWPCTKAPH